MLGMKSLLIVAVILVSAWPAAAAAEELDRPFFWPTVRYSRPERLSVGGALQPKFPGALNKLILSGTVGRGGYKAGVGYGQFGGDLMAGTAIHATVLRTMWSPRHAEPGQTFIGIEGQFMAANISLKGGPAFRIGGRTASDDRLRINFSVGYGF
jgi:hypothetical protein